MATKKALTEILLNVCEKYAKYEVEGIPQTTERDILWNGLERIAELVNFDTEEAIETAETKLLSAQEVDDDQ